MIIAGAISVILGIIGVIGCILFADDPSYESAWLLLIASAIIAAIAGILQVIAGIVGIRNSNKPEKASVCIILGMIVLAFNIADQFCIGIVRSGHCFLHFYQPGIAGSVYYRSRFQ